MSARAMNNTEKANAAILKREGFHVFWFESGPHSSGYYATHPKLICQYHLGTTADQAVNDLKEKQASNLITTESIHI